MILIKIKNLSRTDTEIVVLIVVMYDSRHGVSLCGATEIAGVENAIRSKLQGWKMQEWKMQE